MKLSFFRVAWVLSFGASLLLCPAGVCADSEVREIRIGVLTDLSAQAAYWGVQTRTGAELAAEELRRRDINVKLVWGDTHFSATTAVSEAQKMLFVDKVDALYVEFALMSNAVSPIAFQAQRILVYAAAVTDILKHNPYAFKTYLDYVSGCRSLVESWLSQGRRKIGMLKATTEFGDLCALGARQAFPDLVEAEYNYGDDVSTSVLRMKQRGVDAIVNVTYEPDILRMLKSAQALKYFPLVGANADAITEQIRMQFPDYASSISVFGHSELQKEFLAKLEAHSATPSRSALEAAALAYLHIQQLAEAILFCEGKGVECQAERLSASSPDPTIQFQGWKDRIGQFYVKVQPAFSMR